MKLTYSNYLKIDELLSLQEYRSKTKEHDEMLFIIIHQTYELWFKQILHEFDKLRKDLHRGETWNSVKTMRRVLTILKTMVAQVDILETMTPLEFNSFRGFLDEASGFQSVQFREVEILCGLRSTHILKVHDNQPDYVERMEERMEEPTLWESFCTYLQQKGYEVEDPVRKHENGLLYDSNEKLQQTLIEIMKNDPETAMLCELFVDFDEGMQEWRYRHVKMVERTIGNKMGTGGSDGVGYLRSTLHQRIFPDLWEIRSEI
ncbi:tryptophan 2,3-dioxygenase [Balneolaceae bacterium YR4-1]|uniref:Tryptophan 2,3-dioxygenase n=1 Tax=Halalkalibaculum roseum TaxID=2709311 RepID=A0A6M1SW41_9BACT|nr:tryptophan 2,3-dioxygenase family protein [Halalkalibaculum roseum]NGP77200.1 tryptophan 2,3-dioxygenase [Halalkalibaculum roseum]